MNRYNPYDLDDPFLDEPEYESDADDPEMDCDVEPEPKCAMIYAPAFWIVERTSCKENPARSLWSFSSECPIIDYDLR